MKVLAWTMLSNTGFVIGSVGDHRGGGFCTERCTRVFPRPIRDSAHIGRVNFLNPGPLSRKKRHPSELRAALATAPSVEAPGCNLP
jgi:hypothetical protein